jgi:hypothetical protein
VRTISFEVDFRQGQTRRSSLCGILPNPYVNQRQYLRDRFGFSSLLHYAYINVLVLKGRVEATREYLQETYPNDHERFRVYEIGFDTSEQTNQFYHLLLPFGTEANGKVRTQGRMHVDSVIGYRGMGNHPSLLLEDMLKAKLPGVNEAALRAQMKFIIDHTTPGRPLNDILLDPWPIVVLLESRFLGPGHLIPLEVAIMAALSEELRDGTNPLRWYFLHEMGKQGMHEVVEPYLLDGAANLRHQMCSYYIETQQIGWLPRSLISPATGILQFKGASLQDYKLLQELYYGFDVPFRHIAELQPGQAIAVLRRASNPAYAGRGLHIYLRPTVTWAGGETLAAV